MHERLTKVQRELHRQKLLAFVIVNHEDNNKNLFYLTGFSGSAGILIVTAKNAFLCVDGRYTEQALKQGKGCRIIERKRHESSGQVIARALTLAKIKKGAIGYEGERISVLTAKDWQKEIKGKLIPTKHLVEKLRQYKDLKEITAIQKACKVSDAVFKEVVKTIQAGMRESDIAAEIDYNLRKHGACGPSFPTIVASGSNSAMPHHEPTSRRICAGEPVIIDFGALMSSGYCSDITRTIFVPGKKPLPKLLEIYKIALEANRRALKGIKKGMSWKDYEKIARDYITEQCYGKKFIHGLGHSLGLEVHDPYDYKHDGITKQVVFTNEPGIYLPGIGGVRIEDDLVMRKDGVKKLSRAPYPFL